MFKLRQFFGLVVVFLFFVVDKVSSFLGLKVTRDGLVQHSYSFLSLQKLTVNDHALKRSQMIALSGENFLPYVSQYQPPLLTYHRLFSPLDYLSAAKVASTKICPKCSGKEVIACVPCKGTGIDRGKICLYLLFLSTSAYSCLSTAFFGTRTRIKISITISSQNRHYCSHPHSFVPVFTTVNGSLLERWCCKKCKGFGLVPCTCSSSKGLTPEQSGER